MVSFNLSLCLEAIYQLDRELGQFAVHVEGLVTSNRHLEVDPTVGSLRQTHRRGVEALDRLRDQLLDRPTNEGWLDHRERTLRTRGALIVLQLADLKHYERAVANRLWSRAARLRSVDEVSTHVLERITAISGAWNRERKRIDGTGEPEEIQRAEYLAALSVADRGFVAIGRDSDVATFLAAGASVAVSEFRNGCRVIAALLEIELAPISTNESPAAVRRNARTPAYRVAKLEEPQ